MDDWGWDGHMGGGAWLLMTLFWLAIIGTIIWAVARIVPARGGNRVHETPDEILDRRLATGEIDIEMYDALRQRLHATREERR